MGGFADGHNGDKVRMLTYVLMGILVLALAGTTLWGIKCEPNKNSFMSIEDTTFLRGFWCIIVVLVHVPAEYQNRIQDMLGSFAYIGVTFFFMTSAYGLKWSLEQKPGYMDHFWRRRLPPVLIPALIANALLTLARAMGGEEFSILSFININDWVKVLLLYYICFWLIYGLLPRVIKTGVWQDIVMCLIVIVCSLIDYFTEFKITSRWIVEPLGFAYGILAAKYAEEIKSRIKVRWIEKSIALMFLSGILGIAYLKYKPVFFWGDYILKTVLGMSITWFIFTAIGKFKVGNKVNNFLGKISYEVYLLHYAVFSLMRALVSQTMNSGIYVIVSILLTLVLSICLKRICKPFINKLSDIGG